MAFEQGLDAVGAGEVSRHRPGTAVDDDWCSALLELRPHVVESRIERVEAAHLDVHLEDLRARVEGLGDVGGCLGFGVERRAGNRLRRARREIAGPRVEPRGHARPVRVVEGAEPDDAEVTQGGHALLLAGAVGDRPRPRRGLDGVEVTPHLVEHVLRHEVRVDVDEAGQAQTFGVRAHRGGFVVSARRGQVRHQARMPQPAGSVGEGGQPIARGHAREGQGVGIDEGRGRPDIGPREIRAHHGHRGEG